MSDYIEKNVLDEEKLKKQVGKNLTKLREAVGLSAAKFAGMTGISEGAFSNYANARIAPPLFYLANICAMDYFKGKGLNLTLDKFLMENFNPAQTINGIIKNNINIAEITPHKDFEGCYLCYFFDQSKSEKDLENQASRGLRYGVISVFNEYTDLTGNVATKAVAAFYKQEEEVLAFDMKDKLDAVFSSDKSTNEKNMTIMQEYEGTVGYYDGAVSFSDRHMFISLESDTYGDRALMVLYSPPKKKTVAYIGGIGSIVSVSHGREHVPVSQKIILSKYTLGCSNEEIAEHLSMATANITQAVEAEELTEFCRKLFDGSIAEMSFFDEYDKTAMIQQRLKQLVKNYVEKNVCCVGVVSEDDDKKVLALIRRYAE